MNVLRFIGLLIATQATLLWTTSHGSASFCVFRTTDLTASASTLPFAGYTVNEGQAFDLDTNHFVAPQTGWYWLHWSVGMEEATHVYVALQGTVRTPTILRQNSSFSGTPITTSRDELVQLEAGSEVWLSSESSLFANDFKQITFSGFDLNDVSTGETVAFSVGLSASLIDAGYEKIPYDIVLADSHGGWDTANRVYVVPENGTYVITAITGVLEKGNFAHDIMVDDGVTIRQLVCSSYFYNTHTGYDTISRTIIATLHAGERLYAQLYTPGYSIYSDSNYQTALMAFRYAPAAVSGVSWSVKRNSGADIAGPEDPFIFNTVLDNNGGAWNEESNKVRIPQAGNYYVHISAGVYRAAAKMDLMINGFPYANVHHESVNNGFSTHSRGIMLRLSQNDELYVRVPSGYTLAGLVDVETTFSGFLIN